MSKTVVSGPFGWLNHSWQTLPYARDPLAILSLAIRWTALAIWLFWTLHNHCKETTPPSRLAATIANADITTYGSGGLVLITMLQATGTGFRRLHSIKASENSKGPHSHSGQEVELLPSDSYEWFNAKLVISVYLGPVIGGTKKCEPAYYACFLAI